MMYPVMSNASLELTGLTTEENLTNSNSGTVLFNNITMPPGQAPYQLIWTGEVMFRVIMIVIVMVLTLVGNTMLILMIMCYPRQRRKRVNIFLVNLAVGDLMCLFTMTTEILFVAFGEWVMGAVACKLIVYGQMVTLASATFLLTGMSIDRYQVLVQPLRSLGSRPRIWRKVTCAWVGALVCTVPQLFIFVQTDEGLKPDGSTKHLCRSQGYTEKWQRKVYFSYLTAVILVVPMVIMSFCYLNIIRVVWRRTDSGGQAEPEGPLRVRFSSYFRNRSFKSIRNNQNGADKDPSKSAPNPSYNNRPQSRLTIPNKLISRSKRKVVKMTLSVIIGFLICWTPYFVASLIRIYSDYRIKIPNVLNVAEIMALVHSALNPILYGIFSSKLEPGALVMRILRCKYRFGSIDRINEQTSDDDTWAECRRLSMEIGRRQIRKSRLHRMCCYACDRCRKEPAEVTYGNVTTIGIYQELLPNGGAVTELPARPPHLETDSSDAEATPLADMGFSSTRAGRQTQCVVYSNNRDGPNGVQGSAL